MGDRLKESYSDRSLSPMTHSPLPGRCAIHRAVSHATRTEKGWRHAAESHEATQGEQAASQEHPAHEGACQEAAPGSESRRSKGEAQVTRMIHGCFCCTHGFAAATSLAACLRQGQAGGLAAQSVNVRCTPPSFAAPRARLATRLREFATNHHESRGLICR